MNDADGVWLAAAANKAHEIPGSTKVRLQVPVFVLLFPPLIDEKRAVLRSFFF